MSGAEILDPTRPAGGTSSYARASRVALIGLVANGALGVTKLAAGYFGRSEALIAAGLDTAGDFLMSIVILWGLREAAKPPDDEHRFGHGKAESLAARNVSVILLILATIAGYRALHDILYGRDEPLPAVWTLWFAGAGIAVKGALAAYKFWMGRRLRIDSLVTDAWNHLADTAAAVLALAGIGLAIGLGQGWRVFDPVAALGICGMMLLVGLKAYRRAGAALMDASADFSTEEAIRTTAEGVSGVQATEKLMTRRSGPETHVELHVEVDPELSVDEGHAIATRVAEVLKREVDGVTHVSVHIEPHHVPGGG